MSFRDDREAAHRRADALEQELKKAQAELAAARAPRRRAVRGGAAVAAVLGATTLLGAGAVFWLVQHASERAQAEAEAEAQAAAQRAAVEARMAAMLRAREEAAAREAAERAREAAAREAAALDGLSASGPTTTLTWPGTVGTASGVAVAPGAPCTLTGAFSLRGRDTAAREMTLRCGAEVIYQANGLGPGLEVGLREGPIAGSEAHEYMLRYRDAREGERTHLEVSTIGHSATAWRAGNAPMRVTVFLRDVSDPREGESVGMARAVRAPAFAGVVERAARVTSARGRAPVAAGERCAMGVRPVWEFPENCRVAVRCGETWLYGAREAGYLTCEVQGGHPVAALDENPTSNGGDPRITWRGRRVVVSDFTEAGEWSVDLAL